MCGVMLKHHGYNVTILERETSPSRQGYDAGIKIGPAVEEFLKKHDRVNRDISVTCRPGFMINMDGKPQAQRGQTMVTTSWGLMVSVLRSNFDGLTSTAVPAAPKAQDSDGKATFRFGARATSINEVDGKVEVKFLDAKSGATEMIKANIAIVADGSNSDMRSTLLPDIKREYLGYMCWRGTVREENIDDKWNELYAERATLHLMNNTYLLRQVPITRYNCDNLTNNLTATPFRLTMEISPRASACIIGSGTRIFQQTHLL
jgi:2-polyprenyl-6-methoxyphenol hydroxylase-like FAD-dependent oxidoreductase